MRELRETLLRRFYENPERLSRNQNFHAFLDPKVRNAARAGRLLRSLRADLLERNLLHVQVDPDPAANGHGGVVVELIWREGLRRSYLTDHELAILCEDQRVSQRLRNARTFGRSEVRTL